MKLLGSTTSLTPHHLLVFFISSAGGKMIRFQVIAKPAKPVPADAVERNELLLPKDTWVFTLHRDGERTRLIKIFGVSGRLSAAALQEHVLARPSTYLRWVGYGEPQARHRWPWVTV
jgi:hypothetical protein